MLRFYENISDINRYFDYHSVSRTKSLLPFQIRDDNATIDVYLVDSSGVETLLTITVDDVLTIDSDYILYYSGDTLASPIDEGVYYLKVVLMSRTVYSEYFRAIDFDITTNERDFRTLHLPLVFSEEGAEARVFVFTDAGELPPFQHLEKIAFSGSATATLETDTGEVSITNFQAILEGDYVRYRSDGETISEIAAGEKYRVRINDGALVLYSNYFSV